MNGVHDMGGHACHGPIDIEKDEPLFHEEWESRVLAMTLAMGATGLWNIDSGRAARESLPPAYYLSAGYYRIWFAALCNLLVEHGLVSREELATGISVDTPVKLDHILEAPAVKSTLAAMRPYEREQPVSAMFKVGDRVVVRNYQPNTHTRLPAYIRGHSGTVVMVHGNHVFPDSHAIGEGEDPRCLYNVSFDAQDLWGSERAGKTARAVHVDCWEPYLEAATS